MPFSNSNNLCGIEVKNPIGVTACDFVGSERLLRRCAEQGIGWIIGKTVHKIDGPHRWPRPYFYSLRRFGRDLADSWICSQMFHNKPYEMWRDEELPRCLKACEENDMLFIGSCSGIGTDIKSWIPFLKEMEAAGVKMVELDTGGPHATFGAVAAQKDVGAPLAQRTPIVPEIDENKCNRCGVCARLCPYGALSFDKGSDRIPMLNLEYCQGCGWCVGHCMQNAIACVHAETGAPVWNGFGTIADWV